jgi:hypothetical protein
MLALPLLSPILALIVVGGFAFYFPSSSRRSRKWLFVRVIAYGLVAVVISLALTVGWMYWYETASGFSAGNAPVFWMLFLGPLSAASGELVALLHWWTKKTDSAENPIPST